MTAATDGTTERLTPKAVAAARGISRRLRRIIQPDAQPNQHEQRDDRGRGMKTGTIRERPLRWNGLQLLQRRSV